MPINTLSQIQAVDEVGVTAKQDYIEAIHARHAGLFESPVFIAGTHVESLQILPEGVFVPQQIELFLDPRISTWCLVP